METLYWSIRKLVKDDTNRHSQLDVLYEPSTGNTEVDIVFVHGLNAMNVPNNRIAAWTAPNGVCWPKDLLPRDIPTARIMAFGYNSNVAFSRSLYGLDSHGQDLLYWLDHRRPVEDGSNRRPLVFVAHSLGGIVIKHALFVAKICASDVDKSTHGLIFFGTPHYYGNHVQHGNRIIKMIDTLAGVRHMRDRNDLMARLKRGSPLAAKEAMDFEVLWPYWRVTTFYEGRKTPVRGLGKTIGKLLPKTFVVDKEAAIIGGTCVHEKVIMLDTDHTNMNKFPAASHPMYVRSADEIKEMVTYSLRVHRY